MQYKWTVLFLVHASTKQTRDHVKDLFATLKDAQFSENIKVVVLYGGLQYSSNNDARMQIQVTLHEVALDERTGLPDLKELSIKDCLIDIGDDKILKKIFAKIREDFPSERFLLFTWDHGFGFGIFKSNPLERRFPGANPFGGGFLGNNGNQFAPATQNANEFFVVNNNYSIETPISVTRDFSQARGIIKKNIKTSMLTNDELRNTIKYHSAAPKVDLLVMMNCGMQMIETGYALHDAVNYLVAPETCIFWAGYDYEKIINTLCTNPDIETEDLGVFVLDTIQPYYEKKGSGKYFKDLVVSLITPPGSLKVKSEIDEIAKRLENSLDESFQQIKELRKRCEDLTQKYVAGDPYHYVDFLNCIATISSQVKGLNIIRLEKAMKQYVIHMISGENHSKPSIHDGIGKVNGFTIYFPTSAYEADSDFYYEWFYKAGNQETLFASDCYWKNFLQAYFRYDRR